MPATPQRSVLETIRENFPAYEPVEQAAASLKIPLATLQAACDRVYNDGMYGPISAADWLEQDGREPAHVSDALKIMQDVAGAVEDYTETETHVCGEIEDGALACGCKDEFCEGHEQDVRTFEADAIVRAYWPWFVEIYGCSPRSFRG